jgi:PilZ domain
MQRRALKPDERRRHQRVGLDGELQVRGASDCTWTTVFARDISTSGIGFESPVSFARGEEIYLWLPDSGLGEIPAVVRFVMERNGLFNIGVELDAPLAYEIENALAAQSGGLR